jgi:hypothetical protein
MKQGALRLVTSMLDKVSPRADDSAQGHDETWPILLEEDTTYETPDYSNNLSEKE